MMSSERRIVGPLEKSVAFDGQGVASIGTDGKPECSRHGAMNRVAEEQDWWRCLMCNVGVECELWEPKRCTALTQSGQRCKSQGYETYSPRGRRCIKHGLGAVDRQPILGAL